MGMTAKGEAFVSRMQVVIRMAKAGTPLFAAMAAGLEDEDWMLVFVAACKMARDIEMPTREPDPGEDLYQAE